MAAPDQKYRETIFNLDHRLYTLQKYVACKSQVGIGHTFMKIFLNLPDFTVFF